MPLKRVIEGIIQRAIEEGAFDNLKGKGKPLNLNINPMVAEDWRLAYSMLADQGYSLPWMEERNLIERELEAALTKLRRTWAWRQKEGEDNPLAVEECHKAAAAFKEKAAELNKRIEMYNLQIPADVFYRPRVDVDVVLGELKNQ